MGAEGSLPAAQKQIASKLSLIQYPQDDSGVAASWIEDDRLEWMRDQGKAVYILSDIEMVDLGNSQQ